MARTQCPFPIFFTQDTDNILLLHGDGIDASTSIVDSSISTKTITPYGTARITNEGHAIFNGSNQQLTIPDSGDWYWGNGNWTVDVWVKLPTPTRYHNIVSQVASDQSQRWAIDVSQNGLSCYFDNNGTLIGYFDTSANVVNNVWTHIAFVRSGSTGYIFVNGVSQSVVLHNAFSTVPDVNSYLSIGAYGKPGGDNWFGGAMKKLRITKGVALWTSNFDPTTIDYTPTSNTKLLLEFQGNTNDTSGTEKVITNNNGVKVSFAGVNSSYTKKGYITLNGSSQYLSVANSTDFDFSTGDFTIEVLVNKLSSGSWHTLYKHENGPGGNCDILLRISDTDKINTMINYDGNTETWSFNDVGTTTITSNCWHHIAVVRNGSSIKTYIDGVVEYTQNIGGTALNSIPSAMFLGADANPSLHYLNGKLMGVRVSKGIARWTSDFILPVAWATDSYTKLLLEFKNNANDTSGTGKTITNVGSAPITYPQLLPLTSDTGAIWVSGSTGYLTTPNHNDWNFGTHDFTMEAWVKLDVQIPYNAHYPIVARYQDAGNNFLFSVYNHQNYQLHIYWYGNNGGTNWNRRLELPWGTMQPNIWYHVAIVKQGTSIKGFLNGVGGGMHIPTMSDGVPSITTNVEIGWISGWSYYFNGSIDELRVSKIARYTSNFTPQTTPFNN